MRRLLATGTAVFLATAALAEGTLIDKPSPHDVAITIDRLERAVEDGGASVIARVDHSGAAEEAGLELRPTQLLIFGNPKLGTPLMQENQRIGLGVPLRVVAFEDGEERVHLVYEDPAQMAAAYGVEPGSEAVAKISTALDKLTDKAVAAE